MTDSPLIVQVREMILSGALPAGGRITEARLAETLRVSRTPIRSILPALAGEGLLRPAGRRGYAVTAFAETDSIRAIELRAMIEGLAARTVAQAGISDELRKVLLGCLADGDAIFAKRYLVDDDEILYGKMNEIFHSSIVAAAGSSLIDDFYARIKLIPFASPSTIAFSQYGADRAYEYLFCAHRQHHGIVEAILGRDSARAEFLFREHANQPRMSLWPSKGETEELPRKRRFKRKPETRKPMPSP